MKHIVFCHIDNLLQVCHISSTVCTHFVTLDMKGCICHFTKWHIHPFISKGTTLFKSILWLTVGPYWKLAEVQKYRVQFYLDLEFSKYYQVKKQSNSCVRILFETELVFTLLYKREQFSIHNTWEKQYWSSQANFSTFHSTHHPVTHIVVTHIVFKCSCLRTDPIWYGFSTKTYFPLRPRRGKMAFSTQNKHNQNALYVTGQAYMFFINCIS